MAQVTMKQIALEAGVSIGTVDRVLHNRGKVSQENQKKIEAVCRKYNYRKNLVGRALYLQRKAHRIAVVCPSAETSIYSRRFLEGLEETENEASFYNIEFVSCLMKENTAGEQVAILTSLLEEDLYALIVKPILDVQVQTVLQALQEKGVRILFANTTMRSISHFMFVGEDHVRDGRLLANIVSKVLRSPVNVVTIFSENHTESQDRKLEGFFSFLDENGIPHQTIRHFDVSQQKNESMIQTIKDFLLQHPETNLLYFHTQSNTYVREIGKAFPSILRTSYGTKIAMKPLLEEECLDFGICVSAYDHGKKAGTILMEEIVNGTGETEESYLFHGIPLFKENC